MPEFRDTRRIASHPTRRRVAQIDREVTAAFTAVSRGVQIPILDIPKIFAAGHQAALAGRDVREAVAAAVQAVRVDGGGQ